MNNIQMMKSIFKCFRTGAIASLLLLSNSCNNTASTHQTSQAVSSDTTPLVVSHFADQVVIPTYQQLVQEAGELSKAVNGFVENPTPETLKTAQNAWVKTRTPWEQSEAFAFGPAESLGYDGDLDDWPVNETDVVAVINSQDEINVESVKKLQTTQKGFHTIEYLLFGLDAQKTAQDFSKRELKLLQNLTIAFNESAHNLTKTGTQSNSISALVAQKNPELDQKIKQELKAAIEAVNAVPNPIEATIKNSETTAKLTSAKSAILTAFTTIETQLLPLFKTT